MTTNKKNKLVIFDLDETLIHSMAQPLERDPDFVIEPLSVYVRPYAKELIEAYSEKCDIAVWSAGSQKYVEIIVDYLIPESLNPVFVWDRSMCTVKKTSFFSFHEVLTKDLNKMTEFGYDLSNTIIIEDDPIKISKFKKNAIIVSQYFGNNGDKELLKLAKYVDAVDTVADIRTLDKNLWNFKE